MPGRSADRVGEPRSRSHALHPELPSLGRDDLGQTVGAVTAPRGRAGTAARSSFAALCILALLGAVAALSFLSGGYILQLTAPVVFALAAVAVVAVWRAQGLVRPSRPYLVAVVAFAAFVAWTGLSILWSAGPDLSWISFDLALVYLLVMIAIGLLPGGPLQLRLAAHGFGVVVLVVAAYALLGKVAPDLVTHAHLFARLRAPVGYWNVLAGLIVMAIPVFLVIASNKATPPWVRGLGAAALVVLVLTFFFTFSRGGYVALAAALLVFFVFTTRRLSAFASLAVAAALAGGVLLGLRDLGTLFSATVDSDLRSSQAHALAIWLVFALAVAFAAQVLVALAERRWTLPARQARLVGTTVVAVLVIAPLALGTVFVLQHGGGEWVSAQYHAALSPSGPSNDVQRLASLGSSGRIGWYRAALRGFRHHPVAGTGAGTFRFTDVLYRENTLVAKHSHSQWLNVLTELGVVGFVLFALAIGGLVAAAFGRLFRDRRDPHRALLAACQAAIIAFIVHISVDWGWDMPAITIAFLLLVGVSASYVRDRSAAAQRGRASERAGRSAAGSALKPGPATRAATPSLGVRLLATGVILFGVVCWALPYLAEGATAKAQDRLSRGQVAAAEAGATRAAALDPLAVDPLLTLAAVHAQRGDLETAAATLERAMRLQPDNYEPYYRMGNLQLKGFDDKAAARLWYLKALELNPMDPGTRNMLGML